MRELKEIGNVFVVSSGMKVHALLSRNRPRVGAPFVLGTSLSLAALVLLVGGFSMHHVGQSATPLGPSVPMLSVSSHTYASPVDSVLAQLHGSFLAGEPTLTRAADARLDDAAFALQEGDAGWEVVWSERDVVLADARATHLRERLALWKHGARVRVVARKDVPGIRARPLR